MRIGVMVQQETELYIHFHGKGLDVACLETLRSSLGLCSLIPLSLYLSLSPLSLKKWRKKQRVEEGFS